ncbi:MAG: DEAD/DEAH box helicase [Anaerolineae bacterium]|nr:DEAD/DEAH box helicase [Anaerolineae bacterium]
MSTTVPTGAESGLSSFLPPVRAWFEETFGLPTPPQSKGWPAIQRGEHTLILAPTGSGKTLAAFLWGIDRLFRELLAQQESPQKGAEDPDGVRIIYISPLKALNNDIHRNLRVPLAGIRRTAKEMGLDYPVIQVAVRSGDTPQRERQAMIRNPPHILITTPESFYLLLTSPKAREILRTASMVILDEIHTLAGNKRGVHLSVSLERLEHLVAQGESGHRIQRLGLSATIQPLDEVARFLGGSRWHGDGDARVLQPRPVTIVDAGYRKALDLQVVSVIDDFRNLPGDSIWPSIIPNVLHLIQSHQTTLVFANSRRQAERTADRLNEQWAAEDGGDATGLIEGGVAKGNGMFAVGTGLRAGPISVHHGSIAKEARLELERRLKKGELPALVGTSSLELGIDIGAVDLVVQLQSPKSVAQGLQRVGRSGHLVGQTSTGRIFPTHREDVIEAAAIAGGMLRGDVEPTHTPRHPLDVLAQHIVAMVSVENWDIEELFEVVRRAYAYNDLTWRALQATLEMLSGRYPSQAYRELRARVSWDRVNNKLSALPGSRMLALTNGGTIPDTGSFGAYLADGKTKLGQLDEEFVFETKIGDTLMLGSQVWRVIDLTDDRVIVADAAGAVPRMPFWRGDFPWRPYELGVKVGAFRREIAERLRALRCEMGFTSLKEIREHRDASPVQALLAWMGETYALDARSAWHTVDYLANQLEHTDAISSDRTVVVEVFEDALGDPRMVIHSPFGGRVNGPWALALAGALRERTGVEIEVQTNDDGILLRLLDAEAEFPLDVVTDMTPAEARERILRELPDSSVFGAHFRQNAARALLLPGAGPGKRTPFWLQRLRARDLLQVVKHFDDFPIVAETYRDCLQDILDVPHLEEVLTGIQEGRIDLAVIESITPSPVAQSLLWNFISIHMYDLDAPRAEKQLQTLAVNRDLLQDLLKDVALDELLRPEAITAVRDHLQHTAPTSQVRTLEELAVLLQQMGDLSSSEIAQRATLDPANWIARLTGENRVIGLDIPTIHGPTHRWVASEYVPQYVAAFEPDTQHLPAKLLTELPLDAAEARRSILDRFLHQSGPITLSGILARYAFPESWLQAELDRLIEARDLVHGRFTPHPGATGPVPVATTMAEAEFVDRRTLEQIHRRTLGILRKEVQPVTTTVYAEFLARWQHVHPEERLSGREALAAALQQLRAAPLVGPTVERDVLSLRLQHYDPDDLEALCQSGELVWLGAGGVDPRRGRVRFLFRGEGNVYLEPAPEDGEMEGFSGEAQSVYAFLRSEGAVFFNDITEALDLNAPKTEAALVELIMAGLATNDSVEALRRMVEEGAPQPSAEETRKPYSSLEAELALRRGNIGFRSNRITRLSSTSRYKSAKQRVRRRLAQQTPSAPAALRRVGRWAPVHRFSILGKAVPQDEITSRQARQLLARYGVVTRLSLTGESGSWDWSRIYRRLQRMEMRGEIRRGYFIQGLPGVQFALPDVVELLRALRDNAEADDHVVVMNACDPANLYGPTQEDGPLTASGEPLAFPRVPSTWLVLHRGIPVLVAGTTGHDLTTVQGADVALLRQALRALLDHLATFERRITVETWDGEPVADTAGAPVLETLGFRRSYPAMIWERRL